MASGHTSNKNSQFLTELHSFRNFHRCNEYLHTLNFVHPDQGSVSNRLSGTAPGSPDHGAQLHLALCSDIVDRSSHQSPGTNNVSNST